MTALFFALTAAASYLLGCVNGSILVSKYILHNDVREHGSGGAGLTNFHRTFGGPLMLAVVASDAVKMILAVVIADVLLAPIVGALTARLFAGAFCVLGHSYPAMFGFKGGKGILSAGTLVFFFDWRLAVLVYAVFLLAIAVTRWVSLGSVLAAITFAVWMIWYWQFWPAVLAIGTAGILIWRHKDNLKRIAAGTESKFSFHRKKEEAQR